MKEKKAERSQMLYENAHGPTVSSEATSHCMCVPVVRLKAGNHYLDTGQGGGAGRTRGGEKREKKGKIKTLHHKITPGIH